MVSTYQRRGQRRRLEDLTLATLAQPAQAQFACQPPAWKRICARRRSDTGHRTIEYEPGQRKGIIEILHVMRFTPPPQPARHVPIILLEISISFQPPTALRRLRTEGPEALLCPPANDRMAFEQPGGRAAFVGGDGTALARGKVEGGNGGFTARPAQAADGS